MFFSESVIKNLRLRVPSNFWDTQNIYESWLLFLCLNNIIIVIVVRFFIPELSLIKFR